MKRKTLFIIGGVAILGIGAFLAFRKKTIRFYDNVWCTGSECNNIQDNFGGASGYINYTTQNAPLIANSGGVENAFTSSSSSTPLRDGGRSQGNNTGNLNLLFQSPHGLKAGDEIYIKQDAGATYDSYNGQTIVAEVYTDYIIRTNKPRS